MSLFKKYGPSLLDQPIGIEESRVRQAQEAEAKGTFQDIKRQQRIARRAYRKALRDDDPMAAMKALDWVMERTGETGSGIQQSGAKMNEVRHHVGQQYGQPQASPQPASTDPVMPQMSDNLRQRNNLFSEMTDAAAGGNDLEAFRARAAQLGVDDRHFVFGADRARQEGGMRSAMDAPDTNSSSFMGRLAGFAGLRKPTLFDQLDQSNPYAGPFPSLFT